MFTQYNMREAVIAVLSTTKCSKLSYLIWLLLTLPLGVAGQHLEAFGGEVSVNVTQTIASPVVINLTPYKIVTNDDLFPYDEIGYKLATYARWQVGLSRFFVQPELGYTSTRGQAYGVYYYPVTSPLGPDEFIFSHQVRRWEIASLAGMHTSRRTYVLVGPLLIFNQQQALLNVKPGYPATEAIYNSFYQSVEPVQLLGQVGVGFLVGRFDFNLRYEQSLTPYTRRFVYDGNSYGYRQQIRQGLFTAGFLLYKSKQQAPVAPAY